MENQMIKSIATLTFLFAFLLGNSSAQESSSDWQVRQPSTLKSSDRNAPSTSTSISQKEIEAIIDRFISINQKIGIANTEAQLVRNASNLDLMIDQIEKVKRIERATNPRNRPSISETRKQLERILEIRIRQHNTETKHLLFLIDFRNAQGYLDTPK
jgi:hypothetical protein